MSTTPIKYALACFIGGHDKADISYSSDQPFQSFAVGDSFYPDPNIFDTKPKLRINAVAHRIWEGPSGVTHCIELELSLHSNA